MKHLPEFVLFEDTLVHLQRTPEGGLRVLRFVPTKGSFVAQSSLLGEILYDREGRVTELSRQAFEVHRSRLSQPRKFRRAVDPRKILNLSSR